MDKTDGKDPERRGNYLMSKLKTYALFGLNIGDSVWRIPCRSINVTGGLTYMVFFGILVTPGMDLGQDFLDMAYVFWHFWYYFFRFY